VVAAIGGISTLLRCIKTNCHKSPKLEVWPMADARSRMTESRRNWINMRRCGAPRSKEET